MESVRAELVRSYIRPPPNRTACDCCFDLSCSRKSSSGRSDCKSLSVRKSSFFRKGDEASSSSTQYHRAGSYHNNHNYRNMSSARSSSCLGRQFNRHELGLNRDDDPPPPYSERRSPASTSSSTSSSFKYSSREKGQHSDATHSRAQLSSSERPKQ